MLLRLRRRAEITGVGATFLANTDELACLGERAENQDSRLRPSSGITSRGGERASGRGSTARGHPLERPEMVRMADDETARATYPSNRYVPAPGARGESARATTRAEAAAPDSQGARGGAGAAQIVADAASVPRPPGVPAEPRALPGALPGPRVAGWTLCEGDLPVANSEIQPSESPDVMREVDVDRPVLARIEWFRHIHGHETYSDRGRRRARGANRPSTCGLRDPGPCTRTVTGTKQALASSA